jgi:hypothetical protein
MDAQVRKRNFNPGSGIAFSTPGNTISSTLDVDPFVPLSIEFPPGGQRFILVDGSSDPPGADGGDLDIEAGQGAPADAAVVGGPGGDLTVLSGNGGVASAVQDGGSGGYATLGAGDGGAGTATADAGNGGYLTLLAGNAGADGGGGPATGGNVIVSAGDSDGGSPGDVAISGGNETTFTGAGGDVILTGGVGGVNGAVKVAAAADKLSFYGVPAVVRQATPAANAAAIIVLLQTLGLCL